VTGRVLLRWGDLDDARRRASRPWFARSPWIAPTVAGAALAGLIAWVLADGSPARDATASHAWLAAAVVVHVAVMLSAPTRLYWRHDAVILSRLPMPGGALFAVAVVRSLRTTAHALVVCLPAALVLGRVSWPWAARHLGLLGALGAASALLVPAAALGGGALVAFGSSAPMTTAARRMGVAAAPAGAPAAHRTQWLGALPGFAMSAVVITTLVCVRWLDGAPTTAFGPGWIVVAALAALSAAAALVAYRGAPRLLPAALREVVALDRQQLAHLEIHPPGPIERAAARLLGRRARLVHGKDARLMRRRYPLAFVAGAAGTLTLWILAAARPADLVPWATAVAGAMTLYAAALARRLSAPPIELARTIGGLPVAGADVRAAKRLWYATWVAFYVGLGAVPAIARARAPVAAVAAVAAAVAAAGVLGIRALAAEEQ
jgi:hypothetical protein